jgi:hypothetical protein
MEVHPFLCDAATVREGLLHILGAGITRINRPVYPAPLGAAVAMMLLLDHTESDRDHTLDVRIHGSEGAEVAKVEGGFRGDRAPDVESDEAIAVPVVLGLHGIELPAPGSYRIEIAVDGQRMSTLTFVAVPVETL